MAKAHEQELHTADEDHTIGVEIARMPNDPMVDVQVATAKQYPRSIARFRKEAEAMALLDEETAGECFYALPRSGKTIEGPSARLAEILVYAWGNARADAEVIEEGDTHLTAQGTFFDLERNIAIRKKVKRRITDSRGNRYNDDMIGVTGNAANSIALRNVVFAGIPKALWKGIYLKARQASIGQGGTLTQKRQAMLEWFGKLGVEEARVLDLIGVEGIEDVKEDQIITLRGIANAVKEGETTVEELFAQRRGASKGRTSDINERLKQASAKKEDPKAQEKASEPAPEQEGADDLKPLRDELNEALAKSAPHLLNDKEARAKWIHRLVGHTAAMSCSEFEIRQLMDALTAGDTDPDGAATGDGGEMP